MCTFNPPSDCTLSYKQLAIFSNIRILRFRIKFNESVTANNIYYIGTVNEDYLMSSFHVPAIINTYINSENFYSFNGYIVSKAGISYTKSGQTITWTAGDILLKANTDYPKDAFLYVEFIWYNKLS